MPPATASLARSGSTLYRASALRYHACARIFCACVHALEQLCGSVRALENFGAGDSPVYTLLEVFDIIKVNHVTWSMQIMLIKPNPATLSVFPPD